VSWTVFDVIRTRLAHHDLSRECGKTPDHGLFGGLDLFVTVRNAGNLRAAGWNDPLGNRKLFLMKRNNNFAGMIRRRF
jgi:hypothetical protein